MHTGSTIKAGLCAIVALILLVPWGARRIKAVAAERSESAVEGELLAFTAISLKEALRETIEVFQDRHPGIRVRLHSGASGLLARQIERGAPADLFLSAAPAEIDRLQESDLLDPDSRIAFGGNRLVIAVARGVAPPATFRHLSDTRFDRIAIGNPRTVPAGRYAVEALRSAGLYETLRARLVTAENARQVLDYVRRGETSAGLVYVTDARLVAADITVGPESPPNAHQPIVYQAAVPRASKARRAASLFLDFLISEEGQTVLARFGFLPTPTE